jgi:hypothetical protein
MADTPTTRGAYRKQGLGDRSAAWGLASGLNGVFDSMDEAIHGFNGVSLATVNYTLSSTNYTTNEVRQRFHRFTNGGISANPTITVPATQNWWLISNAVSGFDLVVSNGSNSVTIDDGLTALVATDGTNVYEFPMFSTLVAPDPGSNGIVVRTALGATVARTLTGPAAGITVTAGDGVSANPTLALANDLAAVEGLASTGLAVRTAADTWAARTLTGPAAGVSVTNGDGVSGNPTISLANDLSAVEGLASNGIAVRTATDTWAVRTLTAGGGITITHGDGISANPTVAVDINGSASAVGGVASDDEVLIYDTSASAIRKATVATISGSSSTTVSISANDTTPAVLATKLVAGTGITLTENNDGGNETLTVAAASAVTGPGGSTDNAWARWSGSAGLAIQNGKWVEADTGAVTAGGDLDMSGYDLTVDFSTIEAAGEHAEEIDANATGTVTIQATDPTVLRRTLTGDVTLLVAGAPTPGKGWSTELRTTQDGTGGRDLTILPVNQLTYSADLQSTAEAGETRPWTDINTSLTQNAAVAPDGRTTLQKLIGDVVTSSFQRLRAITGLASTQTLSLSAILRDSGENLNVFVQLTDSGSGGNNIQAIINPATGAVVSGPTNNGTASSAAVTVTALQNSCYRVDLTGQPSSSGSDAQVQIGLADGTNITHTGDGTSGVFIGNVQVNTGQPVGMIPVATTRAASVVWRGGTAAEIDYAAQAAAAESRIIIGVGSDGEILIDDVSVET